VSTCFHEKCDALMNSKVSRGGNQRIIGGSIEPLEIDLSNRSFQSCLSQLCRSLLCVTFGDRDRPIRASASKVQRAAFAAARAIFERKRTPRSRSRSPIATSVENSSCTCRRCVYAPRATGRFRKRISILDERRRALQLRGI